MPRGAPDLGVSFTVRGDTNCRPLYGFLIDPNGEPVSEKTNQTVDSDGNVFVSPSLQFNHRDPQPGRWRFVLTVFGPIAGSARSTPFTGEVKYGLADVHATGVPSNPTVDVLAQGKAVQATVSVTNHGAAADSFFVDGRSAGRSTVALAGRNAGVLPAGPGAGTAVPGVHRADRDRLADGQRDERPAHLLRGLPVPGGPRRGPRVRGRPGPDRRTGRPASVGDGRRPDRRRPDLVGPAFQIGPFTDTAPKAQTSFTATAHTAAFDAAVTSSSGDPLLGAVTATPPAATPLQLDAGQTGTVTVTINPTAAVGTVVHGVLFLDTIDAVTGSVDEITAVPYSYTVGPATP